MPTLNSYPAYKPSGIEWIGDIPQHWEVNRVKYVASINDDVLVETTNPNYEIEYVEISGVNLSFGIIESEILTFKNAPSRARRKVKHGDIIISTVRTYLKAIAPVINPPENLIVSTGFAVIRPKSIDSRFAKYLFNAEYVIGEIIAKSVGVSYPAINSSELGMIKAALPPLPEQTAIAAFLDEKTAQIDRLVEGKNRLIALLREEKAALINETVTHGLDPHAPRKPSGLEYLGEIPAHWEVKKLKWLAEIISKGTTPSTEGKEILNIGTIRFIKAENIKNNFISNEPVFYIDEQTDHILSRSRLKERDILIVIAGATIGKVAILNKDFIPANTNQAVCFIRPLLLENEIYIWYWLQSSIIKEIISLESVQAAQPNLSMERIGNFIIPYPSPTEQSQIVTFLDRETARIEQTIGRVQQEIELLREYRTALISEVVTGKVCVVPSAQGTPVAVA